MDKVYIKIGKLVHYYQKFEKDLELLLLAIDKKGGDHNFSNWIKCFNKPIGAKLCKISDKEILTMNEMSVIEYIKDKRNYVVHEFFIENEGKDIQELREEFDELTKDVEIIIKALEKFIVDYNLR